MDLFIQEDGGCLANAASDEKMLEKSEHESLNTFNPKLEIDGNQTDAYNSQKTVDQYNSKYTINPSIKII